MNITPSPAASSARPGFGAWLHYYGPAVWAAAVLLGALYFLQLTNDINVAARPGRLGPAWWPRTILILMVLASALDFWVELRKGRASAAAWGQAKSAEQTPRVWWLMALGLAVMLAYVNLTTILGFPTANFLFMIAFLLLGGFKRPIATVVVSAVGTVTLVLLFVRVVYISLPLGEGPFQNLTLLLYSLLGII